MNSGKFNKTLKPPHPHKILKKFPKKIQVFFFPSKLCKFFPFVSKFLANFTFSLGPRRQIRSFPFGVYKYYIPPNGRFRNLQYSGAEFAVDVFQNLRAKCAQFAKFEKFAVRKSPKVHVEKTLIV